MLLTILWFIAPSPPGFVFPQHSQSLSSYLQDQPYTMHMHTPDAGESKPTEIILGHFTPGASPAPFTKLLETELAAQLGNVRAFLRTTSYHSDWGAPDSIPLTGYIFYPHRLHHTILPYVIHLLAPTSNLLICIETWCDLLLHTSV